jgi:hypothetical protein
MITDKIFEDLPGAIGGVMLAVALVGGVGLAVYSVNSLDDRNAAIREKYAAAEKLWLQECEARPQPIEYCAKQWSLPLLQRVYVDKIDSGER